MSNSAGYRNLLMPFKLGHLTLKNRIVKTAYSSTGADKDGYMTQAGVDHYEAVARGGVGLFITESTAIEPMGMTGSPRLGMFDDSYVDAHRRIVEAAHRHDCPILMQTHHAGPCYSKDTYGGQVVIGAESVTTLGPSTLTRDQLPGLRPNLPRGLTVIEIHEMVEKFVRAAELAGRAGYDGVELHFAMGYLVNSFFSRSWNKRTDEYGGSVENRARLGVEILRGVRASLGQKFIIGVRMNGCEIGAPDGLTLEETKVIGRLLQDAGADLLNVGGYGYNLWDWLQFPEQIIYPDAPNEDYRKKMLRAEPLVEYAEAVKQVVSVPVLNAGGLTFESAERALRKGRLDLAGFARAFIADPDFPIKLREGRAEDIRRCTHCMTCVDAFNRGVHERCRVNAGYAKEKELQISPAVVKRKVLVIGGGPGGMETARVAALRGHHVFLVEKGHGLGGLVPLAAMIKGSEVEQVSPFVQYLIRQLKKLGVKVALGVDADAAFVRKYGADVVVVASGSKPSLPDIPGLEKKRVLTSASLHRRVKPFMRLFGPDLLAQLTKVWLPVGKRVVLLGGKLQGMEVAEFLVKRGRQVVVTESSDELGEGLLTTYHRPRLIEWLDDRGVAMLSGVQYHRVTDSGVDLTTSDGVRKVIQGDTVMVVTAPGPNHELYEAIKQFHPQVYMVGDCEDPRLIVDAVEAGCRVGIAI